MNFIVDTQVWLWWHAEPERLGRRAMSLLEDRRNLAYLSVASAWEIAIKYSIDKLDLPQPPGQYVLSRMSSDGFLFLEIKAMHALACAELPMIHRDPFDRLLVAQASVERLPILTADQMLGKYAVKTIAAD